MNNAENVDVNDFVSGKVLAHQSFVPTNNAAWSSVLVKYN